MPEFTATAFIRMMRLKRAAASAYLNNLRAQQDQKAFLVQQAVAALDAIDDLIIEAIKLQNAVVAGAEYTIQRDGSVRVFEEKKDKPIEPANPMGLV